VGFSASFPATIIPLNLDQIGGEVMCKHDAFLASIDPDCAVSMGMINSATWGGMCCAGMPVFMQRIRAKGWVRQALPHTTIHVILQYIVSIASIYD
jgi:uncharacterized protein (AIM24 family)